MAVAIHFIKERAEHYFDCFRDGTPIEAPDGWTPQEILRLTGACFSALMTRMHLFNIDQEPELKGRLREAGITEAPSPATLDELRAAVQWFQSVSMDVFAGDYDRQYEQEHRTLIKLDPKGKIDVTPIDGWKK